MDWDDDYDPNQPEIDPDFFSDDWVND